MLQKPTVWGFLAGNLPILFNHIFHAKVVIFLGRRRSWRKKSYAWVLFDYSCSKVSYFFIFYLINYYEYCLFFLFIDLYRIPRYVLLLQQMHEHTPPSHIDYTCLGNALIKMREVALYHFEICKMVVLSFFFFFFLTRIDISTKRKGRQIMLCVLWKYSHCLLAKVFRYV